MDDQKKREEETKGKHVLVFNDMELAILMGIMLKNFTQMQTKPEYSNLAEVTGGVVEKIKRVMDDVLDTIDKKFN